MYKIAAMKQKHIYSHRFSESDRKVRTLLWQELYDGFLSQFIRSKDTVLDIGAGSLEFLESARCRKKLAVDRLYATNSKNHGIFCYRTLTSINKKYMHSIDVVMLSNVLEHLESREEMFSILNQIKRLLKPDGSLLIIQPTIDLVETRYWDFIDHIIPITRTSLKEALIVAGYRIELFIPRFLPYTTKTKIPQSKTLLKMYLMIPWFLRPLAGQCFVRAVPKK